ncbi:hypothetical protein C0583_00010 [Candidatus Parcubacteria bacterium]|nr:MAG: hypothetical protein C0583_00010 [Candidatus Parcubacteria bacterium]
MQKTQRTLLQAILASIASVFVVAAFASATSIGTNISTDGTLTVTGNTIIDTDTFYVDTTNDRVGIGTTSPEYALDVDGYIRTGADYGYKQGNSTVLYVDTTDTNYQVSVGPDAGSLKSTGNMYNTSIGYQALHQNAYGDKNVAIGYQALKDNGITNDLFAFNNSSMNVAIGYQSLLSNTTGYRNIGVGDGSLYWNTTGHDNTAMGRGALAANETGTNNVAIGSLAMAAGPGGADNNVAVGYSGLYNISSGGYNVAIGDTALFAFQDGWFNVGLGYQALVALSSGDDNIAIGDGAGNNLITGDNNIAIGEEAIFASTTASNQLNIGNLIYGIDLDGTGNTISSGNIGIGIVEPEVKLDVDGYIRTGASYGYKQGSTTILYADTTADNFLVSVGYQAGDAMTSNSDYNTAVGYQALQSNTYGDRNVAVGYQALKANRGGLMDPGYAVDNIAIGYQALLSGVNSHANIAIGSNSQKVSTGYNNISIGVDSMITNNYTSDNIAIGDEALYDNYSGSQNVGLGSYALGRNYDAGANTALGYYAMSSVEGGDYNTAVGFIAGDGIYDDNENNTVVGSYSGYGEIGSYNTALGNDSLYEGGDYNTALGSYAGGGINYPSNNNIILGAKAAEASYTASGSIMIGYDIDFPSATTDNQLTIGNLIYGTDVDGVGTAVSSGNVGIGDNSPGSKLEVNGGITPAKVTADPCSGAGFQEGSLFYNDTSDYFCFCDGSNNDMQMHSPSTPCF